MNLRAIAAYPEIATPQIVECPEPRPPAAGEVLCRTLELGVCGTDRDILANRAPLVPPGEEYLILGHECLARVELVGAGVTDVHVDDLVVPLVRRTRTNCDAPWRTDFLNMGDFTERGIMWEHGFSAARWLDRPEHLVAVPPELAHAAVLAEPISVAEKGIREAVLLQTARLGGEAWREAPPRVLVTGMGPIGFAAVLSSRARGWPVTLYGRDDASSARVALAQRFGASYVDAASGSLVPDDPDRNGYDLILECTGSDEVMLESASALAARGVMVWLGSLRSPQAKRSNVGILMREGLLRNNLHIGSVNSAPEDFEAALTHLRHFQESEPGAVDELITARVDLDASLRHYTERVPESIKTVVVYE